MLGKLRAEQASISTPNINESQRGRSKLEGGIEMDTQAYTPESISLKVSYYLPFP